jgi:putative endonuclease
MPGLDPGISCRCDADVAGYVYIVTNRRDGALYVGVTNNLPRRISEHRSHQIDGFTARYNLTRLVYYEVNETLPLAIQREKNVKHWSRVWKVALIEKSNPDWRDLFGEIAS